MTTCPHLWLKNTAAAFHTGVRHQDLLGHAPAAFTEFVTQFPAARTYEERIRLIDRVVQAVHVTGGVTARNLLEGQPRQVPAALDALVGSDTSHTTA
jgi:hypothetical protein